MASEAEAAEAKVQTEVEIADEPRASDPALQQFVGEQPAGEEETGDFPEVRVALPDDEVEPLMSGEHRRSEVPSLPAEDVTVMTGSSAQNSMEHPMTFDRATMSLSVWHRSSTAPAWEGLRPGSRHQHPGEGSLDQKKTQHIHHHSSPFRFVSLVPRKSRVLDGTASLAKRACAGVSSEEPGKARSVERNPNSRDETRRRGVT